MTKTSIRGYCDVMSAAPGESVNFHVSADNLGEYEAELVRLIHGDIHPDGPGYKEEVVDSQIRGRYPACFRRTQFGSYVEAPTTPALHPSGGFSVHTFFWPTTPTRGRQGLVSRWNESTGSGWALMIEDGNVVFMVGDGAGRIDRVVSDRPLFQEVWYSVTATFDPDHGELALHQQSVVNRVNSRFGLVVPLDSDTTVTAPTSGRLADANAPVLIAGLAEDSPSEQGRTWCVAPYNGKIDAPKVYGTVLDTSDASALATGQVVSANTRLAHWDFSAGIGRRGIPTDHVVDVSGHEHHANCINQPDRGMTGWNWDGHEENFVHCPEQYGALWFHEDSLDDCRWESDFTFTIPDGLRSDFYAVRLRMDDAEDYIPFFVLPPRGTATASILLLVSTCSYLAYANEQIMHKADIGQAVAGHVPVLNDRDVELHENLSFYGLSTYDAHVDGRGVQYTSWRRPILNLRPKHRQGFGSIWELPADLHLVDWLNAQGFEYDVATEHDLNEQGIDLLRRYNVVLTGSHPEYYTTANADAWEDYLADGGRGMYLGANGLYWICSVHPEKPWVMEVRKELGVTAWVAPPGESHHSTTGERGGRFRSRARPTQKIWGTGMTSYGFDHSGYFVQMSDSKDPSVSWIMDGVAPDEKIGDFGLVGGGAAGYELDRYDLTLGTPPNTVVLASSVGHSVVYTVVPEDKTFPHPGMNGGEHPLVRADMTYFSTANGGGMFSASSISYLGSLSENNYENSVSRITKNVLSQFMKDEPAPVV